MSSSETMKKPSVTAVLIPRHISAYLRVTSEQETLMMCKVQLGEKIVCTLTYNLRIIGFGEVLHPVSISSSSTGLSQIYWK